MTDAIRTPDELLTGCPSSRSMTDAWMTFRPFVERTEDLTVGLLVRRACSNDPDGKRTRVRLLAD